MEEITPKILQRSSDAVAIIGSDDGVIIDINEAMFAITGYSHDELVGSPCHDLFVGIGPLSCALVASKLHEAGSVGDIPIGLRTRSGELRVARLSALVIDADGRRTAVCTIRDLRDPAPEERRLAAQEKLTYLLQSRIPWPEVITAALQAIGECFRWEFGALWLANSGSSTAQCSVVWRSQAAELAGLEVASRTMNPRLGAELIRRVWYQGEAVWIPDVLREADFLHRGSVMRSAVHGWFAFPVREAASVVGAVEFFSRQTRQPNAELLRATDEFGRAFSHLLQRSRSGRAAAGGVGHHNSAVIPVGEQRPASGAAWSEARGAAEAVAAITEVIERHQASLTQLQSPDLLRELTASVAKLNRLLEDAVASGRSGDMPPTPAAIPIDRPVTSEGLPRLRALLTLKAVSKRTGIPAATLRTWERRYRFMRPMRSSQGYRLYTEEDVTRILQVKHLLEQGVRVGEAAAALVEATGDDDTVLKAFHRAGSA